jgi:hypothetical protein
MLFFFDGAVVISTTASESVTNRCLRFGGGKLTARNCLRELCCELVSAIVYVCIVVQGGIYGSNTMLYVCPSS